MWQVESWVSRVGMPTYGATAMGKTPKTLPVVTLLGPELFQRAGESMRVGEVFWDFF
jgi:hypothetical protein